MDWLIEVDWHDMLVPDTSLLEIFIRGTIVYLTLFVILRVVLKRQRGGVGFTDILVIVLIADAAQNSMSGDYTSVPDGVLLVAVIVGWAYSLDWLAYRLPLVARFVHPPSVPLVRGGELQRRNLAKENITDEELRSQLRAQGVLDLAEVDEVLLEGDGQLSVVRVDRERPNAQRRRKI